MHTDDVDKSIYSQPIPEYGYLMTVQEWMDYCESRSFVDYDGFAIAAKNINGVMMAGRLHYYPSDRENLPPNATHVVWFNR